MVKLAQSLAAWGTPEFKAVLKRELTKLGLEHLPLQRSLSQGSVALDDNIEVMVISVAEMEASINVRVGIFYQSIIAGCSCSDDPTPIDICNEHCEIQLEIDKSTAEAHINLIIE